jgi:hypothetical protein
MGTRNLTKVIDKNGVTKVAQYGQWDGYPAGQGVTALYHAKGSQVQIEAGLARCRFVTPEELQPIYAQFPEAGFWGTEDANRFKLLYPNLVRDTCADILGVVAYSVGEVLLVDESDFEEDTLMCEGIYTINFQTNKFISWYHGTEIEFSLDNLPEPQEYLDAWANERESAEL